MGLLLPALLVAAPLVVALPMTVLLQQSVAHRRRTYRGPDDRSRGQRSATGAEARSRAAMDELCPDGWQADVTLFASACDLPDEAPRPEVTRVRLDWCAAGRSAPPRRIWAPDVGRALEAMLADRIAEETLSRIEHESAAQGLRWPDAI